MLTSVLRDTTAWCRRSGAQRLLRASGVQRLVNAIYEWRALSDGRLDVKLLGHDLAFVVTSRMEIIRLDTYFEHELAERLVGALKDRDVFYDVGANIGMMSLLVAKAAGPSVEVHAFEPEPQNAERLRANGQLNALPNMFVHEAALGRATGPADLYVSGGVGVGTHTILGGAEVTEREVLPISVFTGDDWVAKMRVAPTLMKIDVEGAEMDVLLGFEQLLDARGVREILVEIHPDVLAKQGLSEDAVTTWLHDRGYEMIWQARKYSERHIHFHVVR